jgi:hypothetical protein
LVTKLAVLLALAVSGTTLAQPAQAQAEGAPAPMKPRHVLRPEKGHFDDALAIDPAGRRAALIRTDSASFSRLEIIDLGSGKVISSVTLDTPTVDVEELHLLEEGKGTIMIVRDPASEQLFAALIDAAGKQVAKTPPATAFGRSPAPEALLVAMEKKATGKDTTYVIKAFRPETLATVGKPRSYRVSSEGMVKSPDVKLIAFFDGYSKLLTLRLGFYDKKRDFRRPNRMVILDTLTGKIISETEIEDVYAWAVTTKLRLEQPNRTAFTVLNEDHKGIELVNPAGKRIPLTTAVPFRLYDTLSLKEQDGPEPGTQYFSLSVDPVNPDAVKRQKADRPYLDLYSIAWGRSGSAAPSPLREGLGTLPGSPLQSNVAQPRAVLRARIELPRPVSWRAGHGRLVVLKRFKSFSQGGDELELYDLL